jgi:hypothetical protein
MRRFIRHPSNIPIRVDVLEQGRQASKPEMVNVGKGGLCFLSSLAVSRGKKVHISIPIQLSPFEVVGRVAWCHENNDKFIVGVSFEDEAAEFSVRMVEQVCHIEQYRLEQKENYGRELTSDEAASEWVEKYAASFPKH